MRLLVIDDDAMVRDGVAHLLRAWGAEVAATAGDLQLPERLRRLRPPDLIICDLRLADVHQRWRRCRAAAVEDMENAGLVSAMSTSGQRDILVPARTE